MPETGGAGAILGTGGIVAVGLYMLTLIGVGIWGRFARKEVSPPDYYLGGRSLGFLVLFFTLYASQYSGNTLVGFAGRAYRQGYAFLVGATFMIAVVGALALFAPKLQRLAAKHNFITPGDFIQHRFGYRPLTIAFSILGIWALANYILSNLKAIGHIVEATTGGVIPFAWGVVILALIMVIYETLGGMRSVAWTDLIQGVILMVGCLLLFVIVMVKYGPMTEVAKRAMTERPEIWQAPSWTGKMTWFSTIVIFFFGVSTYPHMVQRVFAAKSAGSLKRSLQFMAFMPLVTTLLIVTIGIVGAVQFPGLSKGESEQILMIFLNDLGAGNAWVGGLMILFLAASLAAIMSTVDSALLSLSSIFTMDIYLPLKPGTDWKRLTYLGKGFSWIIMALMIWLAMILPQTVWRLIELKLVFFVQAAPALLVGVLYPQIKAKPVYWGMLAGVIVTLILTILEMGFGLLPAKPLGVHSGVWGLLVNFGVLMYVARIQRTIRE